MNSFLSSLKISFVSLLLLTLILGIAYPILMWGIGELFFHKKANGELFYYENGSILGSEWIAQGFSSDRYFQPRPSSAGSKGYDGANSSGSNLGPTSKSLIDTLKQRAIDYRVANKMDRNASVPADAITSSGSGLDPHISFENALIQSSRVGGARNLPPERVVAAITELTEGRTFGIFGEKRVNVLRLNLALDKMSLEQP